MPCGNADGGKSGIGCHYLLAESVLSMVQLSDSGGSVTAGYCILQIGTMKLIRLGGHLILWEGGIHHAEIKTAVRAGVPAPDD